ncbi:MAG: PIG-L deacetylase family protein [Candidatus Thorarchaeota archaeon]
MTGSRNQSVLVVVAHPDDESLGAGGTIRRHVDLGIPVDVLCLSGNEERNKELTSACSILGVRDVTSSLRDDFAVDISLTSEVADIILVTRPTIVITHSPADYNRNHIMCSGIVSEAVEWASHVTLYENAHKVERIYHMEVNSLLTMPNIMVNVTDTYEAALKALSEHKSQIPKADGYYLKLYDARTRLRGVQAACDRAEAFTIELPKHVGPFYPVNSVESLL